MIKTIVLDFDGTMADTCGLIVRTMQQTLVRVGLPPCSDEHCAAMIGLPLRQTFSGLMPMDGDMAALCENTYRMLFAENNVEDAVPVFPHVVETMKTLWNDGRTLTIASSRSRHSLMAFLHDMHLENYVSFVVAATDIERSKPAPDMVLRTLENTGGKAEETLVVGDTVFDIAMGKGAHTMTCAVTYGNGKTADFTDADYVIDDFAELLRIVDENDR